MGGAELIVLSESLLKCTGQGPLDLKATAPGPGLDTV